MRDTKHTSPLRLLLPSINSLGRADRFLPLEPGLLRDEATAASAALVLPLILSPSESSGIFSDDFEPSVAIFLGVNGRVGDTLLIRESAFAGEAGADIRR